MSPDRHQIRDAMNAPERSLAQLSLREFMRQAWHVLEPGAPFVDGWAVGAVCEHLQAVTDGQIRRLLINVPPGCTKSMAVNVMWPAWEWGPVGQPHMRYISAGYEKGLATRDMVRCRDLLRSEWYQERWPLAFKDDQDQKTYYQNADTGWRLASSVGGALVGYRGDRIIVDDPHDVKRAESDVEREEAVRWFTETLPTRLNKPSDSAIVVVMQRLHERDISGVIINKLGDEWVHLCLPMEYEADRHCRTVVPLLSGAAFEDPRQKDGDLLWPERFSAEAVEELKETFRAQGGTYAEAAQLQQRPAPRGGGLFKRANFQFVDAPEDGATVRGWDLAASVSSRAAYTAGVKMVRTRDGRLLVTDVRRFRGTPHEVKMALQECAVGDGARCRTSIPQDPGQAGLAQKADLAKALDGFDVRFSPETGDKVTRALPFAAQVEAGNVYLVRAPWNDPFLSEAALFPAGEFADQVDATSRAHHELNKNRGSGVSAFGPTLITG